MIVHGWFCRSWFVFRVLVIPLYPDLGKEVTILFFEFLLIPLLPNLPSLDQKYKRWCNHNDDAVEYEGFTHVMRWIGVWTRSQGALNCWKEISTFFKPQMSLFRWHTKDKWYSEEIDAVEWDRSAANRDNNRSCAYTNHKIAELAFAFLVSSTASSRATGSKVKEQAPRIAMMANRPARLWFRTWWSYRIINPLNERHIA